MWKQADPQCVPYGEVLISGHWGDRQDCPPNKRTFWRCLKRIMRAEGRGNGEIKNKMLKKKRYVRRQRKRRVREPWGYLMSRVGILKNSLGGSPYGSSNRTPTRVTVPCQVENNFLWKGRKDRQRLRGPPSPALCLHTKKSVLAWLSSVACSQRSHPGHACYKAFKEKCVVPGKSRGRQIKHIYLLGICPAPWTGWHAEYLS